MSFSWGVRAELVARAHAAGCSVLVQVGSAAEALAAARAGCDVDRRPGGRGRRARAGRRPACARCSARSPRPSAVPVIAAGGIADAAGVRAAIAAGAAGAAMGTRFVATAEADIHPGYAARLVAAGPADTVHTTLFDGGWPDAAHRVLANSTYRGWVRSRPAAVGRAARRGRDRRRARRRPHPPLRRRRAPARDDRRHRGDVPLCRRGGGRDHGGRAGRRGRRADRGGRPPGRMSAGPPRWGAGCNFRTTSTVDGGYSADDRGGRAMKVAFGDERPRRCGARVRARGSGRNRDGGRPRRHRPSRSS